MKDLGPTIVTIVIIISITYLVDSIQKSNLILSAIKDCSGSSSCIESSASVILYRSTPCLDNIRFGNK